MNIFSQLYKFYLSTILLFVLNPAKAQKQIALEGNWQFLKQDIGGIWEAVRPVIKNNPEALPIWSDVTLPHCVNATDAVAPEGNYYQGPAWYRTQLIVDNPFKNGKTLLHFEGAGQRSEVYVYTTKAGSHNGGYDEWTVDITDAVEAFKKTAVFNKQFKGRIPISVRTDNSRNLESIPSALSDFSIYGGLYRNVHLVYQPSFCIDKIFVTPVLAANKKSVKVNVRTDLAGIADNTHTSFIVKLKDPNGKIILQKEKRLNGAGPSQQVTDLIVQSPKLWSPDDPVLYTLEALLFNGNDTSEKIIKTGFRSAVFEKKGPFYLNGKRLLLRGTHRHEDHAGVAAAMTRDMQREELLLMKEMGVNFIRLGHYQQSQYMLDLCDSLGILVWEEIPWCRGGLGGNIYKEQAKQMLTNMIQQHYNNTSVMIWGLGNENDWPGDFPSFDTAAIQNFMRELNDLSHDLDPSRSTAIRRCDFCKDIPDIYSPTIWAGWYRGVYTDYKTYTKKEFDRVDRFLHVEWGGDSHARRHSEEPDRALLSFLKTKDTAAFVKSIRGAKDGDWNESYICNLVDWHLKEQESMPWLSGTAAWTFKDFSTPIRPDNPVPFVNQKGVVERDLTKKEAFYVFQSRWSTTPMAHIYGHNAPVRWGNEPEEKMVKIYSNCDRAELFVNGKTAGIRHRDKLTFPAAGLYWNVTFKKGANTLKVVAAKGKTIVTDSISFQYATEKWGKPASAVIEQINVKDSIITLQVKLLDANGRQCLDAVNWVKFSAAGIGRLIADMGTSTGSRVVQLYNGVAIIRANVKDGPVVVSASVEGVPAVFISVQQ